MMGEGHGEYFVLSKMEPPGFLPSEGLGEDAWRGRPLPSQGLAEVTMPDGESSSRAALLALWLWERPSWAYGYWPPLLGACPSGRGGWGAV